ncbi:uncharacterized protein TEOVI_000007400 [Trypanosoma equiperdum]|uniref:Uncharacterized protein n=2 Tax=Trypanozoon TaxID=39700 RepID=Q38DC3_TRYB2|nr:hypothetical protein, conserved [Trypanosoma brucei brucei TREU927]EAN77197.1 hypothetical protein, conserved [Trypanosoma brucei brucei TREU927]SCU64342.1 hypothetical protein, conserved [Trypanosoma equiperdum]
METKGSSVHVCSNAWKLTHHVTWKDDGFPFVLHVPELELRIDFPIAHYKCCWACAMLHPVWKRVAKCSPRQEYARQTNASVCIHKPTLREAGDVLSELSSFTLALDKRQKQHYPRSSVSRLRFVHSLPTIIRLGNGIKGTITATFTLQRCVADGNNSSTLFPTFIAVESVGLIDCFVVDAIPRSRKGHERNGVTLLPLQNISSGGETATYDALNIQLRFDCLPPSFDSSLTSHEIPWELRVYAVFYESLDAQVRLDDAFRRLAEWHPSKTMEERFAVVSPGVDPSISINMELRHKGWLHRHIKEALNQMDCRVEGDNEDAGHPPAELRPIATLEGADNVVVETCPQAGSSAVVAVLPRDTKWPLVVAVETEKGMGKQSPPIPGSSSLERLSREFIKLWERLSVDD